MRAIRLLLGKDVLLLRRSPALAGALIVYPLVVALLVGLVVRYAGERPRVALVAPEGLPSVLVVGKQTFDLQQLFDSAKEVKLVRMPAAQADSQLASGQVLAILTVPKGFTSDLRGLEQSPKLILRTTRGGLSTRVVEKLRSFVYSTNLDLQKAYIEANLSAVEPAAPRRRRPDRARPGSACSESAARAPSWPCSRARPIPRWPRARRSSARSWAS